MNIQEACLQLLFRPKHKGIQRVTWKRDNAYLHLRPDGKMDYVFFGSVVVGSWNPDYEDLTQNDWDTCEVFV